MTERINLDDVEVESEDEASGNDGDWLWGDDEAADIDGDTSRSAPESEPDDQSVAETGGDSQGDRVPHVPREGSDSPAGIPKDRGGAGAGAGTGTNREATDQHGETADDGVSDGSDGTDGTESADARTADGSQTAHAGGPHGGGVDEMTTAYTYEAVQRLEAPRVALAETNEWSDWVGLVGDVQAYAINKFLREHELDIDFFNGSGDGPGERLAAIDEHSMFYAERMVLVGTDEEHWMADEAGWEFVSLSDAAESAGWSVVA